MKVLLTVFVVLSFVLSGLLPIRSVYGASSGNPASLPSSGAGGIDAGLSSEEISSISDFQEQTKKSLEESNILIRNKELDKARRKLEDILSLVRKKISIYEDKAKTLVSEEREDIAKIYYREASSLSRIAVQISKSLQEITRLEIDNKIELSKKYIAGGDFAQAQTLLEETLKLLPEGERNKRREVESLIASIPNLTGEYESKKLEQESTYYTTKGLEYLETGRLDEAETSFNKALDILSNNRRAKDGLVRVEREQRRMKDREVSSLLETAYEDIQEDSFDEAEKKLQRVLTLEPGNRKAQDYLAQVEELRQAKTYKDLLADIDRKIEEGKSNLSISRFEEAEVSFNEALKLLSPNEKKRRKEIESLLASIPELKQKHKARENYDRIEEIVAEARKQEVENKFEELIKQGRDYLTDNNFEEAKRKFLEASRIKPQSEMVGKYLLQTEQAKKGYENRKGFETLINEGKKYLEAEQLDKADAAFRQALKMSPSEDKKIEVQSLLGDIDKARQTIYNKKFQEQADKYIAKGVENLKKNQYDKARANFEKALSIKPGYSEAEEWLTQLEKTQEETHRYKLQTMMTQGKEYLRNNQFDKASAKFEEILKIDSTYPEALRYLEIVEKAEHEYKNKQQNKQQFAKIKSVVDNGVKFLEEGQFDKAESVFKEAVDMSPPEIKGQTVKTIEDRVSFLLHKDGSQQKADRYISKPVTSVNNNEIDENEELKKANLEYAIKQLVEQIKNKIEENEKVLEREN